MNWGMETNYPCPSVVHHSTNNSYVHLADCVLSSGPSNSLHQQNSTNKSNEDQTAATTTATVATTNTSNSLMVNTDEFRTDSIHQISSSQTNPSTNNAGGSNKQSFPNVDLNGSKVIRLVRAKQATKRKSSLDTLIEVVQKELLRVNGQSSSTSPSSSPPHHSQTRSISNSCSTSKSVQNRPVLTSMSPLSQPLTTVSTATMSPIVITSATNLNSQTNSSSKIVRKRVQQQKRSTSNRNRVQSMNNDDYIDEMDPIDEISSLKNNDEHDESIDQIDESTNDSNENIEEIVRETVDRLVAITLLNNAPFIVNMLTAIPGNSVTNSTNIAESKLSNNTNTSTNKNSSNTSPSTTAEYFRNDLALLSSTASDIRNSMQQNSSPVKHQSTLPSDSMKSPSSTSTVFVAPRLLNFQTVVPKPTTNIHIGNTKIILVSPTNQKQQIQQQQQQQQQTSVLSTSPATCLINSNPIKLVKLTPSTTGHLSLAKNVQIVLPSRTPNETVSNSFRPMTKITNCSIDSIPQATQEVTITTSPTINKPRRRSSSSTTTEKPVGKILRPIAKVLPVYSPNNSNTNSTISSNSNQEEILQPMTVNLTPTLSRTPSTHGPMIYRMTSVNSNVPVFRVRTTPPTNTATIKHEAKPITLTPNTSSSTGSVSVLACFKTTKKRNKERAIMPRPSTTDANESNNQEFQQRLSLNSNISTTNNNSLVISNSTSVRLLPSVGPIEKTNSTRPLMEDKGIQCIDHEQQVETNSKQKSSAVSSAKKRTLPSSDQSWTVAADTLLRNVLSQYGFRFLDVQCQQNLSSKFDSIQANLVSGMIPSREDFYKSVVEIKENLLQNGLSKISADNLEKLFNYFEVEYPKIYTGDLPTLGTNERKRTRRQ